MAVICPTVLAQNTHQYRQQVERVAGFAKRLHLDFTDGIFAANKTIELTEAWLPPHTVVDLHIMHALPHSELKQIVALQPHLVIVHAEAEGNFVSFADVLHGAGIKAGVALLPATLPEKIKSGIKHIDHVLIFSGDLGRFGGQADLKLLDKVKQLKLMAPTIEIGWDGGINKDNIQKIARAGVDVLNVGGAIQQADNPATSYEHLQSLLH